MDMDATTTMDLAFPKLLRSGSAVICIEQDNGVSTWLRSQPHNKELIVVESSSYGDPLNKGYSMIFHTVDEYVTWLEERFAKGWSITFAGDTEPLNEQMINATRDRILKALKNG